jgi:hypothetical protein
MIVRLFSTIFRSKFHEKMACGWPNQRGRQEWTVRFVLCLVAALFCTQTSCSDIPSEAVLTVKQGGRQVELPTEASEKIRALVATFEQQLSTVDGMLRLAVSTELIENLRQKETIIEIRYPNSRSFILEGMNNYKIEADSLLVPLTGEFAEGEIATIFVHLGTWRPGPYRKSGGLTELRHLVKNVANLTDLE